MSNQKVKSENYSQFGGINSKASPYVTGAMEFLDLTNLDFQTPGSLTERWGSTMYVGQTFPGQINSLFEFAKLDGSSYVVSSYSGGIYFGATTGQSQGVSLTNINATTSAFSFYPIAYPFFASGQFNYKAVQAGSGFQGPDTNIKYGAGETFVINPQIQSDNTLSYAPLNNYLFMADGSKFIKFDGITATPVGLPPVLWATTPLSNSPGASFSTRDGATVGFQVGASIGVYYLWASYVNNRGFEGPLFPILAIDGQLKGSNIGASAGSAPVDVGSTLMQPNLLLSTPLGFGISSINVYTYYDATPGATIGNGHLLDKELSDGWQIGTPVYLNTYPSSGSTQTWIQAGADQSNTSIQANIGKFADTNTLSYLPIGMTIGSIYTLGSASGFTNSINAMTSYFPRYVETFQNRLFLAGFSLTPSTVWFSDLGEPEGYAPDFNFEVRTNNGDYITAIKSYETRFYIFKQNSFHVLTGDNPANFSITEVSDQFGCLNNRCTAIYDNTLLFLDRKGVAMWNGANVSIFSQKIQPLFDQMNYAAALTNACMVHDKLRSQVLVAFPIGNSTTNNVVAVYDYLVGAWTTYKGLSISALAKIQGRNNSKNAFYGSYSGTINWFGSNFLSDNGVGFTTYMKIRFLHDMGDSTQKMFRRLYVNADSPASSTLVFGINFFQDYGSSAVLGTTMVLSQFQNRIDFGISAKSIAFEMSNIQTNIPLRVHGFTVESRYLRRT